MSLTEFDGPHFSPDLIGPDGRMSRLHKGGQHRANAIAQQAAVENARMFKVQQAEAAKLAENQKVNQAQENLFRERELDQNEQILNRSGSSPATQYIKGANKRRRKGFGIDDTRGANAFGLGGGVGTLG